MCQITDLWKQILTFGEEKTDRTGTGTKSIFGHQMRFDLQDEFPLLKIKKTLWKSAFVEMLWFLRGENNTKFLHEHNVPIWDDWADKDGNLGPIYGVQWRKWRGQAIMKPFNSGPMAVGTQSFFPQKSFTFSFDGTSSSFDYVEIDQIKNLIKGLKENPNGRRHIVTAWNPAYVDQMGLPPCHYGFQCYVSNSGGLDLMLNIRSMDTGLGTPFNVAQYAFLTHLIARAASTSERPLTPRYLIVNCGDAHVYSNHIEQLTDLLKPQNHKEYGGKTKLIINTDNTDIDGYKIEDFSIEGYECGPFVKLPIAV